MTAAGRQAPGVEMVAAIKRLIAGELDVDSAALSDADAETPLLGLGMGLDSIDALRLATALERHFNIQIPDESLTTELFANVGTLAAYVTRQIVEQSARSDS